LVPIGILAAVENILTGDTESGMEALGADAGGENGCSIPATCD
jgi:hypothetical protein